MSTPTKIVVATIGIAIILVLAIMANMAVA
jgi:hypothetical protein